MTIITTCWLLTSPTPSRPTPLWPVSNVMQEAFHRVPAHVAILNQCQITLLVLWRLYVLYPLWAGMPQRLSILLLIAKVATKKLELCIYNGELSHFVGVKWAPQVPNDPICGNPSLYKSSHTFFKHFFKLVVIIVIQCFMIFNNECIQYN